MINNRKIKKQQMLMDFSYERPNDIHEHGDYTLSQAANALRVSSQYILWLVRQKGVDLVLKEGTEFITPSSIREYVRLRKLPLDNPEYGDLLRARISSSMAHLRNDPNAASVSEGPSITLHDRHRKWFNSLDVPEINFGALAKELNIVNIPRKKLEGFFKVLVVQYYNLIDYVEELLEPAILEIRDAVTSGSNPQSIIEGVQMETQAVIDDAPFNVQRRPSHDMVLNQHLYAEFIEPSEEIPEFIGDRPVDILSRGRN